jgi:4-hydroxybenzoate polyprenyltransferase
VDASNASLEPASVPWGIFPTTAEEINSWMFWSVLLYILAAYLYCGLFRKDWKKTQHFWINKVWGGANLGVCSLLAPSLLNSNLVGLLGQAPLYLTIAGLTGIIISFAQMKD